MRSKKIKQLSAALLIVVMTVWPALATNFLARPAAGGGGSPCSGQSVEPQNDLWLFPADGNISQKIKIASACTVTHVDIYCARSAGAANATIAFYTAQNKGGSKIGSDSQATAIDTVFAWKRFTFSTPVSLTADSYLTIETMSVGEFNWGANTSPTNYEDTNYDAITGTTDQNQDFLFKLNPA